MTTNEGDFGESDLDAEERANAELNLDDPSAGDDEPWSPPDRAPRGAEWVDVEDETLDQRINQEEHEVGSAYGNPDDADTRPQQMAGGDDPDAIPAEDDVLGGPAYDDTYAYGTGPESAAMRVVEGEEPLDGDEAIEDGDAPDQPDSAVEGEPT